MKKKLQKQTKRKIPHFSLTMSIFEYLEIFLFTIIIILILYVLITNRSPKKTLLPINIPLVGMLPGLLYNSRRLHDYLTEILSEVGGTFEFKGPWFCDMDMVFTNDPANIHHILSKNFSNYPKGPEFKKIFEILGDGIFNSDFESWEFHRRTTLSFMTHVNFHSLLERAVWHTVDTGLLPVLDYFVNKGTDFDMQEIFQRLTFDSICKLVLNHDPRSLRIDLPYVPCEKAFDDTSEPLLYRHLLPERVWKLQRWLKIGNEKNLMEAWMAFNEFLYPIIDNLKEGEQKDDFRLLTTFRKAYEEKNGRSSDSRTFLRDTTLSLLFAGRDTTTTCLTWLFWLIATNPLVEKEILEEIETELHLKGEKKWRTFNADESRRLVYLHAALCESLRLFPPVPLEHKAPIQPDILPSGHLLHKNTKIIVSFYSTGRMETVWGKDYLAFKPERWISERGGIKHEPSYKFPAFNAGPRSCVGKEMAFIQMKIIAATIIYHYNVQLVEGHTISPRDSAILQIKHGLRVRISKRNL